MGRVVVRKTLANAFRSASEPHKTAEALDWFDTSAAGAFLSPCRGGLVKVSRVVSAMAFCYNA